LARSITIVNAQKKYIFSSPTLVHDAENNSYIPYPLPACDMIESDHISVHDIEYKVLFLIHHIENSSIIPHALPVHDMNESAIIHATVNNLNGNINSYINCLCSPLNDRVCPSALKFPPS
jgi:hypothetical protein